jgi:Right handed beta helix region
VAVDWVQVASIDGTTVNVVQPFRMAFTTALPWMAGKSGLGFEPVTPLVQGIEIRNLSIKVDPTTTTNVVALCAVGALDITIDNVTVTDTLGQPFYSYLSKGYALTNSTAYGGTVISELAATVDLKVSGNTFSSDAPGIGVDVGTGFFTITNNTVSKSANAGMYFLYDIHDGTISSNQIAEVVVSGDETSSDGMLILGSRNIAVTDNNLAGGTGPDSVGIDIRPYAGALPEPDTGITLGGNTITDFVTAVEQQ